MKIFHRTICNSMKVFIFLAIFSCITCFSKSWAGPMPMPLEVDLDLADHVVVGVITQIAPEDNYLSDYERWGWVTITITEILKGDMRKSIRVRAATWVSPKHGGSSPPRVYKTGDSGIWVIMGDRISHSFGLLSEERKSEVQAIINSLEQRRWSAEVNGLRAWAGVVRPDYHPNPVIIFAIENVSTRDIYYPIELNSQVIQVKINKEQSETTTIKLKEGELKTRVFCRKISPGQKIYLHPDYSFIDLAWKNNLSKGKYQMEVIYENNQPGETAIEPAKTIEVTAWQGKLVSNKVELILTNPQ